MSASLSRASGKAGLPPGSLVHVGKVHEGGSRITLTDYSSEHIEEREIGSIEDILPYREKDTTTWVDIEGLQDIGLIESIGAHFGIHSLTLGRASGRERG